MPGISTPSPGVYPGVSPVEYHQWSAASNSALNHLIRSPAHMETYMKEPLAETPALLLGRAIHAAVLEPDRFKAEYGMMPAGLKRTTKEGKETWTELVETFGEGNVLSADDYGICIRTRKRVHAKKTAHALIAGEGDVELSMVWEDEETGVLCKARWDRHSPEIAGGAIVDLKTTRDASPRDFERAIFSYGYHRQAAMYLMGAKALKLPVRHYSIIAVEKEPPFGVAVYRITEGTVDASEDQVKALLRRYAECMESGEFPDYPDEVRDIAVPDWAWRVMEEQIWEIEEVTV